MSNQSPTASGKDQFPHPDVANNEEGGVPDDVERGHSERTPERYRQEKGNEGPDEEPGFGQGA